MQKLILGLAALTVSVFAQDLTGTWQGTLMGPQELRTVFKVTKNGNAMQGTFYSIDQGGQGIPVNPITLQGSVVKMSIPGLGGTYEGKLEADGKSISGNWTQGPMPVALNLIRVTSETAWAIPELPPPPKPMAANANPSFEVATIKPSNPDTPGIGIRVNGRAFSTLNTTLVDLITFAFGIHPKQIVNGPAWLEQDKFDIAAQPNGEGQPSDAQWKSMIAKLLAERFSFTFHRDKKELSAFVITVGKGGTKLTPSTTTANLPGINSRGMGNVAVRNGTIADLSNLLQARILDRPVVDQTGLTGRFDFSIQWTPDEFQYGGRGGQAPPSAANAITPPDIFGAFQEQLGLKIDSTKAPVEVFVIDRVTKPTEN